MQQSKFIVDKFSYQATAFDKRVRFIILHYTDLNFHDSIVALTGKNVSSHYLVPNPEDESYIEAGYKNMTIFNLVDINDRAWHAGVSRWQERSNINDTSIGIEIVNQPILKNNELIFTSYPELQIEAVIDLLHSLLTIYPDISPTHILGHSDIAPNRKKDPGPLFPWKKLYDAGIGAWYDEATKVHFISKFTLCFPKEEEIINWLNQYGYYIEKTSSKQDISAAVRAFQQHFRPCDYSGKMDIETAAILASLIEKYFAHSHKISLNFG